MTNPGAHQSAPVSLLNQLLAPLSRSAKTAEMKPKAKRWFVLATFLGLAAVAGYLSRPQLPRHEYNPANSGVK
jgi:hypothetical protein